MEPAQVEFTTYEESVKAALDAVAAAPALAGQKKVLVKPNLVQATPPPVTTPPACVAAVVDYIRQSSGAEVIIAEGCGAADCDTDEVFERLGYVELAARLELELVNLNTAETVRLKNPACGIFPEFHLPRVALEYYIVSVPVLKAHSLAMITGTLKNMMGFAPPRYYQRGGGWKKSAFHARMHESIVALNRYRRPELTVLDATVGLREFHLGGAECSPPVNKIVAGFDPLAVDRVAARLLKLDWRSIPHLA